MAILRYLANGKDYNLIATHDLELTEKLDYENWHFREEMTDQGLTFDYKLHAGVVQTRNAISLLAWAGYPPEIVADALSQIDPENSKRD